MASHPAGTVTGSDPPSAAERLGLFVFSPDPAHTEIASQAGFDFVVVDTEHAPLSIPDVLGHIRSAAATGCAVLVRLPLTDVDRIAPYLDAGAAGVVLPHAGLDLDCTLDALDRLRYPPHGRRAACSGVRSNAYGLHDFSTTAEQANRTVLGWGLIEDPDVVDDIDNVLAACAFDAVIPGPGDLAAALGVPGQLDHPRVRDSVDRIVDAARRTGTCAVGMYVTDPTQCPSWRARGIDFFIYSIDYKVLASALRDANDALRSGRRPRRRTGRPRRRTGRPRTGAPDRGGSRGQ